MAANEKTPQLEPSSFNDRDGLATLYSILGIIIWCLGGVVTVFAILAYMNIGSFSQIFDDFLPSGVTIPAIVIMALCVFFVGLFMMTISKFIHLLKKKTTMTYTLRGLDQVIPKTIPVAEPGVQRQGGEKKKAPQEGANGGSSTFEIPTRGEGVSITFNLQGQTPELPKPQFGASSEEDGDYKPLIFEDKDK